MAEHVLYDTVNQTEPKYVLLRHMIYFICIDKVCVLKITVGI